MFNSIDQKIKYFAIIFCIISMVGSLLTTVYFVFSINLIVLGLIIGFSGFLCSYLIGCILYGFGELIEENKKNNELLKIIAISSTDD